MHVETTTAGEPKGPLALRKRRRASKKPTATIAHWKMAAQPSFVYAIVEHADHWGAPERTGYIKIGTALDPHARLAGLQTGNHRYLSLAACIYGTAATERTLHEHFMDAKIGGSEWFEPGYADAIIAMFREIDWRQRHCGSLDHDHLCVWVVRDVLANRPRDISKVAA